MVTQNQTITVKPGYKKTELGFIPEDWNVKRFDEVMDGFASGQTPYRGKPEYYKGIIPWITSGELNYNVIIDTLEKITPEAVHDTNLKIIPKGTFLFAITGLEAEGTRGSCAITGIEATTNQSCMALYPKKDLLITAYLYHYYIRYGNWLAFRYCQGTKQQSYTGGIAKTLPIILPPTIEEQSAIAQFLNDTDVLIKSLEKFIEKKKNIKQGAMQELLTGKKRLPGFKGEWCMKSFGELFRFLSTANNSRADLSGYGDIHYIHYGDIHTKWHNFLDCSKSSIPLIESKKLKNIPFLEEGDLIIADASEDYIGIGVSIEIKNIGDKKIVAGLHTLLLRANKTKLSDGYKGYIQHIKTVKDSLIKITTGISVYSISKHNLKQIEIPFPSNLDEQSAIAQVLSDMDAEIEELEQKRDKYKMLKAGMMQQLLTGSIRLKWKN